VRGILLRGYKLFLADVRPQDGFEITVHGYDIIIASTGIIWPINKSGSDSVNIIGLRIVITEVNTW
jgi:hypothetical protein